MAKVKVCKSCRCINLIDALNCINCQESDFIKCELNEENLDSIICQGKTYRINKYKKCPNCGKEVDNNRLVCPNCGQDLEKAQIRQYVIEDLNIEEKRGSIEKPFDEDSKKTGDEAISPRKRKLLLHISDGTKIELIPGDKVLLGREGDIHPEFFIPYHTVSRRHLIIWFSEGKWFISDQNSKNGTYLNNERIKANESYTIKDNDIICLSSKLVIRAKEI
jgi:ribosomal protein L32